MIRIVRTATLDALRADSVALPAVRQERDQAKTEAAHATDSAIRAETVAETQLRQLAQLHADRFEAEREARAERDQAEAAARRELEEIRQDVARLREAAADPATGETVRAAIAYGVLKNLFQDAKAHGLEVGRPLDLLAVVLDLDISPMETAEPVSTGLAEV